MSALALSAGLLSASDPASAQSALAAYRPLVERWLGLSKVLVQTASGNSGRVTVILQPKAQGTP